MGASTSLRTKTIGLSLVCRCLSGCAFGDSPEELVELREEFGVLQIGKSLAGHHHDVPADQGGLTVTEAFADDAFEAVALDGELGALLADHQPEARMRQLVSSSQQQNVLAGCPGCG